MVERACTDCHSNKTMWSWYSNIAPLSWYLTLHPNARLTTGEKEQLIQGLIASIGRNE